MPQPDFPPPESADRPYPAVRLLRRHGGSLSLAVGLLIFAAGTLATLSGHGAIWLFAGLAAGAIAAILLRSYVELLRILADLLLPR